MCFYTYKFFLLILVYGFILSSFGFFTILPYFVTFLMGTRVIVNVVDGANGIEMGLPYINVLSLFLSSVVLMLSIVGPFV